MAVRKPRPPRYEPARETFSGPEICYVCQAPLHGQSLSTVVPVSDGAWVHEACRPARWTEVLS